LNGSYCFVSLWAQGGNKRSRTWGNRH
jgi:hypothetical protein